MACLCCAVIPLVAYASYTYVKTERAMRDLESVRLVEREIAVGRALDDLSQASLSASEHYASWGPLVSALAHGDNTAVRRQLETLAAAPGSLAQAYSPGGRLLVSGGGGAVSQSLWKLPEVNRLVSGRTGNEATAGFATIDGGLWVVSAEYIHPAGDPADPLGVLVTARPLGADTIASLDAALDVHLTPADPEATKAATGDQTAGAASGVLNQVGAPFDDSDSRSVYLAVYDADGYRSGLVKMAMDRTAGLAATSDLKSSAAAAMLLALAASVAAALLLSRHITRPLRRLATAAVAIAAGETRQTIAVGGSCEIAGLAGAFNTMSERISERVSDLSEKLGSLTSELADINVVFGQSVSETVNERAELRHMLPRIAGMVRADDACLYMPETDGSMTALATSAADGGSCGDDGVGADGDNVGDRACGLPAALSLAEDVLAGKSQAQAVAEGGGYDVTLAAAPLVRGGVVSGVLVVGSLGRRPFDDQDTALLGMLAGQVAVALRNADTYHRLEAGFLSTVAALAGAVEVNEGYPPEHPRAVVEVCRVIAERLGLDEGEARLVRYGAILHDVGKIGVPERILRKPARLSDEEFSVMQAHPVIGESILSRIEYLRPVGPVVRAAHEHWDGSGYPDGLTGTDIPLASRIVFAGDVYVAMTADRPYRDALSHADALAALREGAGGRFDPRVVLALVEAGDGLAGVVSAPPRRDETADRVLATVLFVDIVDSTVRAAAIGDRAWRDDLRRFHAIVANILKEYRGTEIDAVGDGVFARFDGAARAVRCALALREAVAPLGLRVRIGCHSGEIELAADGVRGLAVHIGARVAGEAAPNEVLVSSTVRDLVAGSGLDFADRGEQELKGVPGSWRLYAAQD